MEPCGTPPVTGFNFSCCALGGDTDGRCSHTNSTDCATPYHLYNRLLHRQTVRGKKQSGSNCLTIYYLTGGNQRELARQKNLKKTQEIHKGKRKEDSLSASQRKQRDSEIMQQKQKAANERKSLQAGAK
ncbi:small EDRK-rich factor 1 [Manacus vitellinus]|uniref:small EDRK-rich factor 1 n=2 Tax=Neoaves TaxID=3078114 RepID=UPI00115E5B5E|nr:small EDRK-rich factor 1 [Manacus vitellinus]